MDLGGGASVGERAVGVSAAGGGDPSPRIAQGRSDVPGELARHCGLQPADRSGTSKVISSPNIAFLTHMVKSAWRQPGEIPVVPPV